MVRLAIWIAAALFLGYLALVALAIVTGAVKGICRWIGSLRLPQMRPVLIRTKRDKGVAILLAVAVLVFSALVIYSTTL